MNQTFLPSKPACPLCKTVLDGATDPTGDAKPAKGDITICLYCAAVLVFEDSATGLQLREPHPAEHAALFSDPELCHKIFSIRDTVRRIRSSQPRKI